MDRRSASKRFGSPYGITAPGVKFEIGRERLIGQQANFPASGAKGATLGMVEQEAPEAPALLLRRDRDILDPQMVRPQDRLHEAGKRAVNDQKVDRVLGDRAVIVGLHGQRLAPDQRDPFGVGCTRQRANSRGVLKDCRPDFDVGWGNYHRPDLSPGAKRRQGRAAADRTVRRPFAPVLE
jgi:hypothetical protein